MNNFEFTEQQYLLLNKNIINIKNEIDGDTTEYVREAMIYFISKGAPDIIIIITSGGGNLEMGLLIYDFLNSYPGKTTGIVYGIAESIAAVILQGCDKRLSLQNSQILFHNLIITDIKSDNLINPKKLKKELNNIKRKNKKIHKIISNRTGLAVSQVVKICQQDKLISPEEAKKLNLLDRIIQKLPI